MPSRNDIAAAKFRERYADPEWRERYLAKKRERYSQITPEQREAKRLKDRRRYWKDPEKERARSIAWGAQNKKRIKELRRAYYLANQEAVKQHVRDGYRLKRDSMKDADWNRIEKKGANK